MKVEFIDRSGANRLIVIFAGWAMDGHPFAGLHRGGYDIAVVWDYTTAHLDWSFADPYGEICIVAWSLGVSVASASTGITAPVEHKITLRLAVNGTTTPLDDALGIPPALFEATAANLTEASLQKFYRRTAGRALTADFMARRPQRSLGSVASELEVFLRTGIYAAASNEGWSRAVVGTSDAVFPPSNQLAAWQGVPTEQIDSGHLPDFEALLAKYIIDKDLTASRFAAGAASYDANAAVQRAVVDGLLELAFNTGAFAEPGRILEVGCGTGLLSRRLARLPKADWDLEMWDLAPSDDLANLGTLRRGDAETLVRTLEPHSLALVMSSSTIQWFNSPQRFLANCARALRPGGMIVASTFGPDNLKEIKSSGGVSLPAMGVKEWLQADIAGLRTVKVLEEHRTLRFADPLDIFRHLKSTGVNSLAGGSPQQLRAALRNYTPDPETGLYTLTYHPVYLAFRAENVQ